MDFLYSFAGAIVADLGRGYSGFSPEWYIYLMNRIIKNILWLLTEHGVRMALGLVVAGVMARQLGVEQYGLFQYALGLVAVFSSISFICGAEVLVPMLTTASDTERQSIIGNAFVVRLFFSVIAFIALLLFAFLTETSQVFYLIALLGTIILIAESFAVVTTWLQSQTNSKPRSILVMCSLALKASFMGLLYYFGNHNPLFFALAYILDPITVAVGLLLIYYKKTGQTFFHYSFPIAYDLFKKGLPFFWGLMVMFAFQRLDLIMLKHLSDLQTLGHYAAAVQLFNQVNAIAPILVMSLAPLLVYRHQNITMIKKNILKILAIMLLAAIVGAIMVQVLAPIFVPLLFGARYQASIPILTALVWVSCLFFINEGLNIYLLKMQKGKLVTIKWLLALLVAVPAYWVLIPAYHATGAVMGFAFSYLVICLFGLSVFFMASRDSSVH